jgi:RNA polymerase sigma-70 factor, ECF subfamily
VAGMSDFDPMTAPRPSAVGGTRSRRASPAMPLAEEQDCVARAQQGDPEAIGRLYDHYVKPLYRFCLARVGNETDAEDLTEEIFLKVMRSLHTFHWRPVAWPVSNGRHPDAVDEPTSPFRAWLFRIARNHVVSHYRREAIRTTSGEVPEWLPDARRGPAELAETRLTIEEVFALVDQLPQAQRDVIRLRFGAGLSVQETAEALDKQPTNVKVLQHKGVKRLKELLLGAEAVTREVD